MKKLLARIKQWNNLNAGLTLVEIIVTMLILVVIALPILGGFIVAARANAMAKDLAYARDAAENVVEVANSAGVSAEVFNAAKWNCTPSPAPNITLAPGVTVTPVPVEEYVVTGIRSGTGTYTAKIICNRTTYQDASDYTLPDMSTLDSDKTVVIFPESNFYKFDDEGNLDESVPLHQFDSTAINDFYNDYYYGVIDIYQNTIYSAYLEEVKRIEKINEENPLASPTPTPEPPVYVHIFRDKEKDEDIVDQLTPIEDFIKRTMNVKIEYNKNTEFADNIGATVSTEYVYEMTNELGGISLELMVGKSFEEYDSVIATYADGANVANRLSAAIGELASKLKEPKEYKVAADTTVDTLENIYLVTYPFHAVEGQVKKYNTLSLSLVLGSDVPNNHLADKNINVFMAVQLDDEYNPPENADRFDLKVDAEGNESVLCLYSQMPLDLVSGTLSHAASETLFNKRENTDGNVLLDVTVKIYNPADVADGKELAEVKTTISSKK